VYLSSCKGTYYFYLGTTNYHLAQHWIKAKAAGVFWYPVWRQWQVARTITHMFDSPPFYFFFFYFCRPPSQLALLLRSLRVAYFRLFACCFWLPEKFPPRFAFFPKKTPLSLGQFRHVLQLTTETEMAKKKKTAKWLAPNKTQKK